MQQAVNCLLGRDDVGGKTIYLSKCWIIWHDFLSSLVQMVPGVPTYVMQPQAVPNGPYGFTNVGMQQPQLFPNFPGQYQYPAPPANGVWLEINTLSYSYSATYIIFCYFHILWVLKMGNTLDTFLTCMLILHIMRLSFGVIIVLYEKKQWERLCSN